jgi:hypothetical protein
VRVASLGQKRANPWIFICAFWAREQRWNVPFADDPGPCIVSWLADCFPFRALWSIFSRISSSTCRESQQWWLPVLLNIIGLHEAETDLPQVTQELQAEMELELMSPFLLLGSFPSEELLLLLSRSSHLCTADGVQKGSFLLLSWEGPLSHWRRCPGGLSWHVGWALWSMFAIIGSSTPKRIDGPAFVCSQSDGAGINTVLIKLHTASTSQGRQTKMECWFFSLSSLETFFLAVHLVMLTVRGSPVFKSIYWRIHLFHL